MTRRLLALSILLCPLLAACSLEPLINHQVVDYFEANDIASNQVILQNILRAKDGAPLHFSELASIRGSLSNGASVSTTFPFMAPDHATTLPRKLGTVGMTITSSPSFDIDSLDTQDFTNGVMRPITPETAQFFLNEGIDYRMVLLLLVSGLRSGGRPEMLLNAPNSSRVVCYHELPALNALPTQYSILEADEPCDGQSEPEFYAFLRTINHLGRLYPLSVPQPPKPVGRPFDLDMTKALTAVASIDPGRYSLARLASGQYQLMSAAHGSYVILCRETPDGPAVAGVLTSERDESTPVPVDACSRKHGNAADQHASGDPAGAAQPMMMIGEQKNTVVFKLRSTLEVIQYVGQILALQQDETEANPQLPERCVTLEYENYKGGNMTCNFGVLFHLQRAGPAFSSPLNAVSYNGVSWSLPAPKVCRAPTRCDHTLETISVISLLLNQNKSSKDIAKTQAVQVVP
ncbi:hypothetical protein Bxe_C1262 [Paraburkholderia xenovorans LB400]|uniref:Lipoprotein n=2 Tax=Paraburkholderia xenovorans TaxID=36873 RepID=Q13FL7_PARXL|nr:hypothetical protein Bxe_C1262 [Paraburkholderia xenovorans LB400]